MKKNHLAGAARAATLRLFTRTMAVALTVACVAVCRAAEDADAPPRAEARRGQDEERRRGGMCMNSCVYAPGVSESRVPADIGTLPVMDPRVRDRRDRILCYTVAGDSLWAADDQRLYRVSGADGKLLQTYDAAQGLPPDAIQSIAVSGDQVWLATLAGLARLDLRGGRIETVPGFAFTIGTLTAGKEGVWLVSDAGAFRLPPGAAAWQPLPKFPGAETLASVVRAGFWWFMWRNREVPLIQTLFSNEDGLYVLQNQTLWRFDPVAANWLIVARDVWQATHRGRTVWAMGTQSLLQYDPSQNLSRTHAYGKGPAGGRPTAMAATADAFYLCSHGRYDEQAREGAAEFVGGGISRLDLASGVWQVFAELDGVKLSFADTLLADGEDVWAAALLYDRVIQEGAHPGMAHVKRWVPHPDGIGLARYRDGQWTLLQKRGLKTEKRWMGPHGTQVELDAIGPHDIQMLCATPGRIWGGYRIVPEHWYGGYGMSAGCLAVATNGGWQGRFDVQTRELNLQGEHAALFGMSRSHGDIFLAEGHELILGLESVGGRCWVISQGGLYAHNPDTDRFAGVVVARDRFYFRASAAAATQDAVWFGGDGGTVSRLDRKSGCMELVGVVPNRAISAIAVRDDRILVGTVVPDATYPIALPDSMLQAPKLPESDTLVFDGRTWSTGTEKVTEAATPYACTYTGPHRTAASSQTNYLYRDGQKIAFLRGVFRPRVLCEDPVSGNLWLGIYSGAASVPSPAAAPKPAAAGVAP